MAGEDIRVLLILMMSLTARSSPRVRRTTSGLDDVREAARRRSMDIPYTATVCSDADGPGWGLYGRDWGCCGSYDGCCVLASSVCFVHDALCRCCQLGRLFCGPICFPDPDCPSRRLTNDVSSDDVKPYVKSTESSWQPDDGSSNVVNKRLTTQRPEVMSHDVKQDAISSAGNGNASAAHGFTSNSKEGAIASSSTKYGVLVKNDVNTSEHFGVDEDKLGSDLVDRNNQESGQEDSKPQWSGLQRRPASHNTAISTRMPLSHLKSVEKLHVGESQPTETESAAGHEQKTASTDDLDVESDHGDGVADDKQMTANDRASLTPWVDPYDVMMGDMAKEEEEEEGSGDDVKQVSEGWWW